MTMLMIKVYKRTKHGTSASRYLRNNNKFPAVIYGKKEKILMIEIDQDTFFNTQTKKNFYHEKQILLLEENKIYVKIKAVQRHPFKMKFYHIDFIRV